ncbi:MAG: glutamate racemase [Candidatus Parcubacteria bacterium]|nr:glutamate racemase [Candidatus Parcubacteria bacterium]
MRIGIFDSGLGGLIILKEIVKKLPQYDYIYLGDNARTPYGNRSQDVIYKFTEQAVNFLFKQDCELIIIACNTASAKALRKIQQEWLLQNYPDRRVLGVIRPVVEKAVLVAKNKIGVIGTKGTINSQAYIREIEKFTPKADPPQAEKPQLEVLQQACPLLIPLIEEGWENRPETKKILRYYLRPLKLAKVDTLILGCTHYPILLKEVKGIMGIQTKVLNSGEIVAESLADYLARHNEIESKLDKAASVDGSTMLTMTTSAVPNIKFFVTDLSELYQELGEKWFGKGIEFEKIELK